ncbi:hypothetical protein JB92DRAFT_2930925 [Gautieria morchelliformis]|nr:hypothetical protein JB92DRAFT_2930925 [Gautieria morchelliformis]
MHAEIQRLDKVLLNSPHLASYVRVLELPNLQGSGLISNDNPLSPLLGKFTLVRELKIWGLNWRFMPGSLRQSISRVLELPSMAFLYVNNGQFICMDDFANFINQARGPIGLSLNRIHTAPVLLRGFNLGTKQVEDNEDNKEKFERRRMCHLTRLDVRLDNCIFDTLFFGPRSHVDVSHVHTLHIHLPRTEDDCVNLLLCAIGSSLKHVSFVLPYAFPALVNLAFNGNIGFLSLVHVNMDGECLSTLSRGLSTVDASKHMHHIELRVEPVWLDHGPSVDWAAWNEVYSVLAGPHFQFLRVLYINVMTHAPANSHDDTLLQTFKDMAAAHPLLATRGVKVSLCRLPKD